MKNEKPFIYVEDQNISYFKTKYIDYEVEEYGESTKYDNKIAFLGSSGQIATHGNIYGNLYDRTTEFAALLEAVKSKISLDLTEDNKLQLKFGDAVLCSITMPEGTSSIRCTGLYADNDDTPIVTNVSVIKNDTLQLNIVKKPINTTFDIVYSSSDESKVTVSETGLLTWVSGGETTVVVACGNQSVTLNVKLDELLNTLYSVTNDAWKINDLETYPRHNSSNITDETVLMADETSVTHNWTEVTTEKWSVSGDIPSNVNNSDTKTIGTNTTNTLREIELSDEFEGNTMTKTIKQSNLTLLPATVEMSCSNNNAGFVIKTNATNGGAGYNDRRTIATLYNSNSPTYYKACNGITSVLTHNYDGIYIPANTTNIKITWNSDNNNWYFAANVFTMNDVRTNTNSMLTRVKDAGWNFNIGVWEFDTASYKEGLYLFGNFAWTKTRDQIAEDKCNAITWEDINFNIELTQEQNWNYFRVIKNAIKVNKTTGEYATAEEIADNTNVDSAGRQGGDTFNGKYYQFYDREGGYLIYDVDERTEPEHHKLVCDPLLHWGSVCFSNIYSYTKDGIETTVTTPLVFATGHYIIDGNKVEVVDVVDIENDVLVKQYKFENRKDDIICAWDFENNKCWAIGYEPVLGYATCNWYIDEYEIENFADPTNTKKTRVDQYYINGTTNNTLQDVKYKNGYLYIATGWGSTKGQTVTVWKINTTTKDVIGRTVSSMATNKEAEGLALMDDYMIVTNDSEMYKVKYNFDIYRLTSKVQLTVTTDPLDNNAPIQSTEDILKTLGCAKLDEVKETYPNIMDAVNGINGLKFSRNSADIGGVIQTGVTPLYTDTIEIKFRTLDTIYSTGAQTLYCTRSNGSQGKSYTIFIVSKQIRADYDNPATADANRYTLVENTLYTYKRNKDGDSMNGSDIKAFKYTSTGEYSAVHPLILGGSTSSATGYADASNRPAVSNYLTNMIVYSLSIMDENGNYTAYLVACEDNKMVDLVTGNVVTAATTNNIGKTLNIIEYV